MVSDSKMKTLLVLTLYTISAAAKEPTYGMLMPNFSSSGPSAAGGTGMSFQGMGWDSLEPSVETGRGRIVNNSILDLEDENTMEDENENMQTMFRPQPSVIPSVMMMGNRQIMTGPSLISGQMLDSQPARPTMIIPSGNSNANNGMQDKKVYRYVSVHVPPPEPILPQRPPRLMQESKSQETHYQIMFIKAPSSIPEVQQIQLPPQPQLKTMVYVLLKKDNMADLIKVSQPQKVRPAKPEVFFIRYKGQKAKKQPESEKLQVEPLMTADDNSNSGIISVTNNNDQDTRPRSTSTTTRPSGSSNSGVGIEMTQNIGGSGSSNNGIGMRVRQNTGGSGSSNYGVGMGVRHNIGGSGSSNNGAGTGVRHNIGGTGSNNNGVVTGVRQSTGGSGSSNSGGKGIAPTLGEYDNDGEVDDNEFGNPDTFDENQYLHLYRRNHHNHNQLQQQVRSRFSFSPSATRYGIVN